MLCDDFHPPRSQLRPGRASQANPAPSVPRRAEVTLSQQLSAAGRSRPDGLGGRRGPAAGALADLAAAGEGGVEDDLRTRVRGRGDMM